MTAEVITGRKVWSTITAAVERTPKGERCVAVAYLGADARRLLPLSGGDTLVVDCSERTAAAGQTNPAVVREYIKTGINVYWCDNLHAKVYVLGDKAIVGSPNISSTSEGVLTEAIAVIRERRAIDQARKFVYSLATAEHLVDEARLVGCEAAWVAPRGGQRGTSQPERPANTTPTPDRRLWFVPTQVFTQMHHRRYYLGDDKIISTGNISIRASERIPSHSSADQGGFRLISVQYKATPGLRAGDVVIQCNFAILGRSYAYPPSTVESVMPLGRGRSTVYIAKLRRPADTRPIPLQQLRDECRKLNVSMPTGLFDRPSEVRELRAKRSLLRMWSGIPTLP